MTTAPIPPETPGRSPDKLGGALGGGFVVLLLGTEAVLTLPDETDTPLQ